MITSNYRSIRRIAQHVTPGQPWNKSQKELAMITTMSPSTRQASGRRGVVLIVVLAMLGLLAVIGVTFATYSNQAQIASRRFIANTKANVDPDSMLNYAIEQLINDSNNRLSSLRGHSLKRDMYGNDSVFHGVVTTVPDVTAAGFPKRQLPPVITGWDSDKNAWTTNIPVVGTAFDGYDFTRWVMKISVCSGFDSNGRPINQHPDFLSQTVEVLDGSYILNNGTYRLLRIASLDKNPGFARLVEENRDSETNALLPVAFSLDGRYLRSFNGAGVTHSLVGGQIKDWGVYPNMRLNTVGNNGLPNGMPANPDRMDVPALDEDYDAADLENWFLALQSADGSISLPSFHRPGIIQYDMSRQATDPTWYLTNSDWRNTAPTSAAKFLRPRNVDGHNAIAFPDIVPDLRVGSTTYGQLGYFETSDTGVPNLPLVFHPTGYDVDNDGDGYNESVWMDLGFPVQTDPNGKKYKPLYAFLVVGLNGRLPLNTAGNLHDRNITTGLPLYDHASHLGTSPSEINLKYALRNTTVPSGELLSLRGLLAGRKDGTDFIEGRWGDEKLLKSYDSWLRNTTRVGYNSSDPRLSDLRKDDLNYPFINPVKPGKSIFPSSAPSNVSQDASDDDTDSFDFLPKTSSESADRYYPDPLLNERTLTMRSTPRKLDTIGSRNLLLAVERQRRFVTPIDPMGTGRVMPWNRDPLILQNGSRSSSIGINFTGDDSDFNLPNSFINQLSHYGTGADEKGRVGYFGYYRSPGLSVLELPNSANAPVNIPIMDSKLNTTHGFWSFLNPIQTDLAGTTQVIAGGSQSALPIETAVMPLTTPTYSSTIASSGNAYNAFIAAQQGILLNRDEADEQNLYELSDQFDNPFRSSDLADLYLKDSLYEDSSDPISSRIVNLNGAGEALQIKPSQYAGTFTQNARKLFSVESWDTNRFSWSTDNPGGAFAGNSWFGSNASASTFALNSVTPSIATGDRRINLNFPIPPYDYRSSSTLDSAIKRYDEPTRLKWLTETYQLMLSVLPPLAIDHPLEKVQLAQYLVNVIDFRDPDSVMTRFSSAGHKLYESTTIPGDIVFNTGSPDPTAYRNLDLWGMEYNPIAINEVLAYEYKHWGTDGKSTVQSQNRIFIELVNTLTASANSADPNEPTDLDLKNWQFIAMEDTDGVGVANRFSRPNPLTGQIFTGPIKLPNPSLPQNLNQGKLGTSVPEFVPVIPTTTGIKAKSIRQDATTGTTVNFTVLANPETTAGIEQGTPTPSHENINYGKLIPPIGSVTDPKTEHGRYVWLYMLRPADLDDPTSQLVVVDSMRFPYMVSDGEVTSTDPTTGKPKVKQSDTFLYSSQRLQPLRGGHAIPNKLTAKLPETPSKAVDQPYFPLHAYGYSEQTTTSSQKWSNHIIGNYGTGANDKLIPKNRIYHSIGQENFNKENWSFFQFNDRDFQSVVELLLVPGCGPGQFTKLFVEDALPLGSIHNNNPIPYPYPTRTDPTQQEDSSKHVGYSNDEVLLRIPSAKAPSGAMEGDSLKQAPASYPYLVDKFYFTGAKQSGYAAPYATIPSSTPLSANLGFFLNDTTVNTDYPFGQYALNGTKNTAIYGGPSADGWHRMLEFFEVPSSMNGAIGPVTEGENGDWFRQPRVPGKLNLNLIVDEEVFLGLVDDPRINLNPVTNTGVDIPPTVAVGRDYTSGQPLNSAILNRGYRDTNNKDSMHQAFSDFLKLRHGGSGTMFAFGSEPVGSAAAYERPYRSLSYPDINFTILRPANLPPSGFTTPVLNDIVPASGRYPLDTFNPTYNFDSAYLHNYVIDGTDKNKLALATPNLAPYLGDPGVRNIFMDYSPQFAYAQPPITPTRRLFQIPDAQIGFNPANSTGVLDFALNSNAGFFGNPMYNQIFSHSTLATASTATGITSPIPDAAPSGVKQVYSPASLFIPPTYSGQTSIAQARILYNPGLLNPSAISFTDLNQPSKPTVPIPDTTVLPRPFLGANTYQRTQVDAMGVTTYPIEPDRRQHPFFRTELLQKVMNLTTVRTQQFAVYVTVGFFEVKKEGNANTLQPDILGAEIDPNNRYTMFAVVDRSKAEGFNPINPGNFRQLVDYSRRLK